MSSLEPALSRISAAASDKMRPLVVDIDGTLVMSDTLIETGIAYLAAQPLSAHRMLRALWQGKASLKHHIAGSVEIDPATLPYDPAVLKYIEDASASGRPVYLASACNRKYADAIASHLNRFDGVFASSHDANLSGAEKARKLVEAFGERGFDYIGNGAADLPVWERANKAIAIRTPPSVKRALERSGRDVEYLISPAFDWKPWIKLIRVHQYAKNALIFLPLFTAHRFDAASLLTALAAFVAFSLCASSAYILNDLADIAADRAHPSKRHRPLASGKIAPGPAILFMLLLFLGAIATAALISLPFLAILLGYFALTTGYTFLLKRKMIIDVITLASLYTIRTIAGAVAVGIMLSNWLLIFSIFFFTSLALMKRYTELATRLDKGLAQPSNRNYEPGDLSVVAALSAAAGLNAVTVFALYISSDAVKSLYSEPRLLWLICPLLMYWTGRALMMSHRRLMHDDPVVFAFKDRISLVTGAAIAAIVLLAI
jgi:4-hydroxybenzoate polyprenyltransferase/phosphoserine phosphatase